MSTLPKITVNVDEMIGANKYSVDEGGSHIASRPRMWMRWTRRSS